ncbi:MAG: hypothetical protein JST22_16535 [Bacteroidetes bacterium]|nr:hypothetical protein [Bacteroidota bacterium]
MKKIGLVFNGVWSQYAFATAPKYRDFYDLLYIHELSLQRAAGYAALAIPFQTNHDVLALHRDVIYDFLGQGGIVYVEGDSSPAWIDAVWEDRPVNNYWWVTDPDRPPVAHTNHDHPVFAGLAPRHACWHTHGVYTRVPDGAEILQTNTHGEIITWQMRRYGGVLFATTLDGIVEHGVQQITHLDNFCDNLTAWLCGVRPSPERMTIAPEAYGTQARIG